MTTNLSKQEIRKINGGLKEALGKCFVVAIRFTLRVVALTLMLLGTLYLAEFTGMIGGKM